ncbi:hypothetical protein DFJ65_3414 [Calidifontibacter indicus]|uniref:Uncharacterized protein n=1 Tax=Calidifontibacter indicus TaxID=419650 RepID=A0A3D9U559_9MICO|nr:hypothetical protein DFJ65_3414 [Calidifontibacter indicus]
MVERPDSGDAPEETKAAEQSNEKGPSTSVKVGSLVVNTAAAAASHEVGSWLGHELISWVIQLFS